MRSLESERAWSERVWRGMLGSGGVESYGYGECVREWEK